MNSAVQRAVAETLQVGVRTATPVSGGDINEAYRLELDDGRRLFVKTRRQAPEGMFQAEADGLEWLRNGLVDVVPERALVIPQVVAVAEHGRDTAFLLLEWLEQGRRSADFDEHLGRGLALLHRSGAEVFGFSRDNFIGPLHQSNRPARSWTEFYRRERLQPQLRRPRAQALLPPEIRRRMDVLLARLGEWAGPEEAPARLHGDLWSGNLHDAAGRPALVDPAAYGGHREMDLAMMRLFGGFSERVFAAYAETFPLAPGYSERVPLWQLYPLLVHVNLFGGSYVRSVAAALDCYVP